MVVGAFLPELVTRTLYSDVIVDLRSHWMYLHCKIYCNCSDGFIPTLVFDIAWVPGILCYTNHVLGMIVPYYGCMRSFLSFYGARYFPNLQPTSPKDRYIPLKGILLIFICSKENEVDIKHSVGRYASKP